MRQDKIVTALIVLLGMIMALWLGPSRLSYPIDDTFITFRYAENLAQGHGFAWNAGGEPTEGYTNFLYVLLLAPFAGSGSDLLVIAQLINVLAVIVCAVFIYKISRRSIGDGPLSLAAFGAILFLLTPMVWANALSGMETVVFGVFLLAGFYYTQRNTTRTLGYALVFLASLVRPEGILFAALIAAFEVKKSEWRSVGPFAIIVALPTCVYYLWKLFYFGHLLPNSFTVKVTQSGQEADSLFQGIQAVKLFLLRVWPLVIASFIAVWISRTRSVVLVFIWGIFIIAAYAVPAPLMGFFDRFFFSSEIFLYILTAIGVVVAFVRSKKMGIAFAMLIIGSLTFTNLYSPRAKEVLSWDLSDINQRLEMIAHDLKSLPQAKNLTIASSDAGIVPYYSGLRHFDLAGLNTTSIAHSETNGETIDEILKANPDILLLSSDWSPKGAQDTCRHISRKVHGRIGYAIDSLLRDPRFRAYKPTAVFLTGVYDYSVLLNTTSSVYRSVDSAFNARVSANVFYLKRLSCIY